MRILILIFIIIFSSFSIGQNLPKGVEVGKCYKIDFDYDREVFWKEIECKKSISKDSTFTIQGEKAANLIKSRLKFKAYQEKLLALGYDLRLTGWTDYKFIMAHHKFLKDKKKAEKKAARQRKKELKDSLKQVKLQNKRLQKEL